MEASRGYALSVAVTAAIVGLMTLAWRLTGLHEVMFPEVAAIAMGCLLMKRRPWKTDSLRLWVSLVAGSLLGLGLVHVPGSVWARLVAAYVCVLVWLAVWRINVVPMLSAALLPLFLGRGASWIYPLSVAGWVGLVLAAEKALVAAGWRERVVFEPIVEPIWKEVLRISVLSVVFAALMYVCRLYAPFAAVPPLAVAYTAFADVRRPVRLHWRLGFLFFTMAAVLGTLVALLPSELHPLLLALAIALFAWMSRLAYYFIPPAAACLLLVPLSGDGSCIWQVPLGALVFLSAGRLLSHFVTAPRR